MRLSTSLLFLLPLSSSQEIRVPVDLTEESFIQSLYTVPEMSFEQKMLRTNDNGDVLPVVVAHGMGDSCFNPGMQSITKAIADRLNTYAVCIGDGDDQSSDTIGGFFMNLDAATDFFVNKVLADDKLKGGFNAIGFSQGNNVIRSYLERRNDPAVHTFISVHGPLAGVASLPRCSPGSGLIGRLCESVTNLVGDAAYTDFVQNMVFQANYLRDPMEIEKYLKHGRWLADVNNERRNGTNPAYKTNFLKTKKILLVKALKDTMIFPKDSEWFGMYQDGGFDTVLQMKETHLYKDDLFGLQTMDKRGGLAFDTTKGNHLQFTSDQLMGWVDDYFGQTGEE